MPLMKRVHILGTPVDCVTMDGALQFVKDRIRRGGEPVFIVAANPEKVYALRGNPSLRRFFGHAAIVVPDGIGIVLAVRLLYQERIQRLAGADLMERICAEAAKEGYGIFVFGGSEEVNRRAVEVLDHRYPGVRIVGRNNGYVKPEQMDALIERIDAAGTDVLFVGLGSPHQENWLEANLPRLEVRVCQCIGGTLDTIAGTVKRAPKRLRSLGLEWLYRLLKQPTRAKRQVNLIRFSYEVVRAVISGTPGVAR